LNGSATGRLQVCLLIDQVEKGGEDVRLHREKLEEQPERVVLPPIERRHASPLSLQLTIRVVAASNPKDHDQTRVVVDRINEP
jgi:hypothetical protein